MSLNRNSKQANSENCGPPLGNNFDLEEGQRSRSRHGITWKGLSQGLCMPNINALSLILQKIWARLKFLWQTDGRTEGQRDGQTEGRMRFNVPTLSRKRGTITSFWTVYKKSNTLFQYLFRGQLHVPIYMNFKRIINKNIYLGQCPGI